MFRKFYPYEYVESVFTIDYPKLAELGYRGIIFDVDNTLVPHGGDSTPQVDALFAQVHDAGLATVLLSDNDAPRIERFLANIESPYVCDAEKPDPRGFMRALEMLGMPAEQVVCVGDQVFTDIRGANSCGIPCILVKYIGYNEPGKKGKRRFVEAQILKAYQRSRFRHRIGDIELPQSRHGEHAGRAHVPSAQPTGVS